MLSRCRRRRKKATAAGTLAADNAVSVGSTTAVDANARRSSAVADAVAIHTAAAVDVAAPNTTAIADAIAGSTPQPGSRLTQTFPRSSHGRCGSYCGQNLGQCRVRHRDWNHSCYRHHCRQNLDSEGRFRGQEYGCHGCRIGRTRAAAKSTKAGRKATQAEPRPLRSQRQPQPPRTQLNSDADATPTRTAAAVDTTDATAGGTVSRIATAKGCCGRRRDQNCHRRRCHHGRDHGHDRGCCHHGRNRGQNLGHRGCRGWKHSYSRRNRRLILSRRRCCCDPAA